MVAVSLDTSPGGQHPSLPGYHWTPARKEALLVQIRAGEIDAEDACAQFNISADELESWALAYARDGQRGLQVRRQVGRRT